MALETRMYTAEDLIRLPDDGRRYELVRGELRNMAPAGQGHGRITFRITMSLGRYIDEHTLGLGFAAESGFLLAQHPDTVRAPDFAFVHQEQALTPLTKEGYWRGAPDLAVEAVSLDDIYEEVEEKIADWLAAGTRLVMVINPRRRRITVHRADGTVQVYGEADTLAAGEVVPGWSVPVAEVFA